MSPEEQEPGLSGLLFGQRWQTAAWRALVVFALAYVLPVALLAPSNRFGAFLQWVATVASFVLIAGAIYRFLREREAAAWVPDEEAVDEDTSNDAPVAKEARLANGAVGTDPAPKITAPANEKAAEPAADFSLSALGQVALERLCMALYQFNGLNSQTVATGVDGEYRIRLVPRNTEKAIAILKCHAGAEEQGVPAYSALLRTMEEEGVEKAFFVAPAGFSREVSSEARSRHVTLVDLRLLQAMLDRLPQASRTLVLSAGR